MRRPLIWDIAIQDLGGSCPDNGESNGIEHGTCSGTLNPKPNGIMSGISGLILKVLRKP